MKTAVAGSAPATAIVFLGGETHFFIIVVSLQTEIYLFV